MKQTKLGELLNEIAKRSGSRESSDNQKRNFNIFSVLKIETKEVILCRLLRELLDPVGCHDMGCYPLYHFVKHTLEISDFTESDARGTKVVVEDPIDGGRRVDIVIQTPKGVLPIEVKIWAKDQEAQLWDYFHFYKKQNRLYADKVYYLTPRGWLPSVKSRRQLDLKKDVKKLSFGDHIEPWLKECLAYSQDETVKLCMGQLKEVIDIMTKEVIEMEILTDCLYSDGLWDMEKASAALLLLKHHDDIHREILKKYLKEKVAFGRGVSVVDCEAVDFEVDKYALVRLVYNRKALACVCVEKNLYLFCKKQEGEEVSEPWDSYVNGQHRWRYLCPEGYAKKAYPLRDITELKEMEINIADILNEISVEL